MTPKSCIYTCCLCPTSIYIDVNSILFIIFHQPKYTDFTESPGSILSPTAHNDFLWSPVRTPFLQSSNQPLSSTSSLLFPPFFSRPSISPPLSFPLLFSCPQLSPFPIFPLTLKSTKFLSSVKHWSNRHPSSKLQYPPFTHLPKCLCSKQKQSLTYQKLWCKVSIRVFNCLLLHLQHILNSYMSDLIMFNFYTLAWIDAKKPNTGLKP